MQRLSGLDDGFLLLETPAAPMHVAGLMILDPGGVAGGFSMARVRTMYEERLHLAPPYRRRLVEVPFGLHHPVWVEDPSFHLDNHLHHIAVPAPGGRRELAALAARLVAHPLDRSRPLWEAYVIEGLEHGFVALLTKVHHAAIDGVAGNEITVSMLDLGPEGRPELPADTWKPEHVPTEAEMLAHAGASMARQPALLARAVRDAAKVVARAVAPRRAAVAPPEPVERAAGVFSGPRTSWNAALTPQRAYAMVSLPLGDAKAVRRAFGTTLNDVVLAVVAGALRRYLDARDEHPDGDLVAMVPISVRTEDQKGSHGNRISSTLTSLHTRLDDPVERLRAVHGAMNAAKAGQQAVGATLLQDWAEFAAPAVLGRAARAYSRLKLADHHRPLFNLTVSNVPGPSFPLWCMGARMVANYPMGPIYDGAGVNVTVMSYLDQLDFGVVSCPALLSDPWEVADGLAESLAELVKAASVA